MEPEKPLPSDCCGNGCSPCVFDIYEQRLHSWQENRVEASCGRDVRSRSDLLSEIRFKPFRLIEKKQLTCDVFSFRFQAVTNTLVNLSLVEQLSGTLPYGIGQHLVLRCPAKSGKTSDRTGPVNSTNVLLEEETKFFLVSYTNEDKIFTRAYTPITISALEQNCCFEIFVKLYRNGIASEYLNKSVVGDILHWRGPYGDFKYKPNTYSHILMLCVGSGLAPMISIIRFILSNEYDETLVHLMFGIRNIEHIILRDELRNMIQFWNFTLEYYFPDKKELNSNIKFGEIIRNQKIDLNVLKDYIKGKLIKNLLVLICGTESFTSEMKNNISEMGIDLENNVHIF